MSFVNSVKRFVKQLLNDPNDTTTVIVNGKVLSYHDGCHLDVAKLPRIQMGQHLVSGINGVSIPEFDTQNQIEEYPGKFDEARVGIHQMFTSNQLIFKVRALYWSCWMIKQSVNPVAVIYRHWNSLK